MAVKTGSSKITSAPLLATRFFSPPLPAWYVSRTRLVERLGAALRTPATLVSATAGFGKSLLVSEWMKRQPGLRGAWLSLEEADNDWVRFYRYLVTAWQRIYPQAGETALAELASSPNPDREMLINSFLNDLLDGQEAAGNDHALVVLDDYHHIESKEIQQTVLYLVEHLPPRCHLALVARSDPPLPLARWRLHGMLFELRADDLRFTADEASQLLSCVLGKNLPGEQIEILEARTEGWVVGLQMAALALQEHALQGRMDTWEFINAFGGSQRYVLDYLLEEVINQQPEETQQFLHTTAYLGQFCAPLCDALLGTAPPYAQRLLERLSKANLFLIPLDDQGSWFRYHHLFADLLQNRLQQTAPERIDVIYSKASAWCAQNGLWHEAIQYAVKLKDYEQIEKLLADALMAGGINFLFGGIGFLVSSIPKASLPGHPCLSLAKAVEMIERTQMAGIEALLNSAVVDIKAQAPFSGKDVILGMIYLIQASAASILGDEQKIIYAAENVGRLLPRESQVNIDASLQLGVAYFYTGDLNQTASCWEQVLNLALEHGYTYHILGSLVSLGRICCHRGELNRGEAYLQRVQLFLAKDTRGYSRWSADAERDYSDLLRERNRLEEAHARMAACLPQLEKRVLSGGYGLGLLHMGRILAAQGNFSGAEALLRQIEALSQTHAVFPDMRTLAHLFRVKLILASGELQRAWEELETCQNSAYCAHDLHQEWALAARSRILIHMGRPGEALHLLDSRLAPAKAFGRGRNWLEMTLLSALALKDMGDSQKAFTMLEEGLAFASIEGFVRIFVDEGEAMQALLQQFRARFPRSQLDGYLGELLSAFPGSERMMKNAPLIQAGLVEPLTEREIEVAHLVCKGFSNQEIAAKLVLSVGTVKNHIHNIFGKLGVRDRPQAIARLLELSFTD